MKWGGAVVFALLIVMWVASGWCYFTWFSPRGDCVVVDRGRVVIGQMNYAVPVKDRGPQLGRIHMGEFHWWFDMYRMGTNWQWFIPLWLPVAAALIITGTAWRLDHLACRRARIGLCPKCRYSRTGLPPNSPCPECGTPSPPL